MFLFYTNDMPENIRSKTRLFADATIVYLTITSDIDSVSLQDDLNKLAKWEERWKMSFHPEKCNVLTISRKKQPIMNSYTLHGQQLEHVTTAKYLGVSITSDMKWNQHISNICKKANNTMSFLKRNLNIRNANIKEKAYKSLVRPTLEYACTTWDPYLKEDKNRIEMVQRRAARYVVNRYHNTSSVTSMLEELKWPTLEERRQRARLVLMYKIVNGLVKIDATDRLVQPSRLSRNMGQHSFQIPSCNTIIRKESFYPRTIRDWNALPTDTATAKSLESFKAHLLD